MVTKHRTGTRKEWLAARLELLEAEKELTRHGDQVARQRQELPWVRVEKDYRFDTEQGSASLADLFRGRSQLLIYNFMFGPDYKTGCASCSAIVDGLNGIVPHLEGHDVAVTVVSRAPLDKLLAFKQRMGWTFRWVSSFSSDFNFDFSVSFTEEQQREGIEFNYQREPAMLSRDSEVPVMTSRAITDGPATAAAITGTDLATYVRDRMGLHAFVIEDGIIYHTYAAYSRGVDAIWGVYPWLDRAPKGRNETGYWWRHHDDYDRG